MERPDSHVAVIGRDWIGNTAAGVQERRRGERRKHRVEAAQDRPRERVGVNRIGVEDLQGKMGLPRLGGDGATCGNPLCDCIPTGSAPSGRKA